MYDLNLKALRLGRHIEFILTPRRRYFSSKSWYTIHILIFFLPKDSKNINTINKNKLKTDNKNTLCSLKMLPTIVLWTQLQSKQCYGYVLHIILPPSDRKQDETREWTVSGLMLTNITGKALSRGLSQSTPSCHTDTFDRHILLLFIWHHRPLSRTKIYINIYIS